MKIGVLHCFEGNLLLHKTTRITIHKKWVYCKLFCYKNCNLGKHIF